MFPVGDLVWVFQKNSGVGLTCNVGLVSPPQSSFCSALKPLPVSWHHNCLFAFTSTHKQFFPNWNSLRSKPSFSFLFNWFPWQTIDSSLEWSITIGPNSNKPKAASLSVVTNPQLAKDQTQEQQLQPHKHCYGQPFPIQYSCLYFSLPFKASVLKGGVFHLPQCLQDRYNRCDWNSPDKYPHAST